MTLTIFLSFRAHIFGLHVAEYMRSLEADDEDSFKRQFGKYIKLGVNADAVSTSFEKFMNKTSNQITVHEFILDQCRNWTTETQYYYKF